MTASGAHRVGSRAGLPFVGAFWLGLLALGIQLLLPIVVAVEIRLASGDGPLADTFFFCPLGHVHVAAAADEDEDADHGDHHGHDQPHGKGLADGCPICVALHGGLAFTLLPIIHLPAPVRAGEIVLQATASLGSTASAPASYNPRAPPLVG